jgi:outer membrane protein
MKACFQPLTMIFALLLLAAPTWAATGETLKLTLPEAIALAIADHPDMALSRQQEQSAAITVETARGRFLPSLQASGRGAENYDRQTLGGDSTDSRTASLGLSSTLNLFNGFADVAAIDGSRKELAAAAEELLRQRQTVAFTAASSFIAVLTDQELVRVAEENLTSQALLLEQIEAFQKAGSRAVTDLYRQQAATAQAELDLLDARRNVEVASLQLLQSLGRTPPATLELQPPEAIDLTNSLNDIDLEKAWRQALEARPDLQAHNRQIEAAGEKVREARAGYLPSVDLFAEASSSYSSLTDDRSFNDQMADDNFGAAVGVAVSIPIFDRDQTRTSVAQARVSQSSAATQRAKLRQQVGVEVGEALADYRKAGKQQTVAAAQLTYAREALAATEARYQVGAATWVELSDARSTFVQARADEVRARYAILAQGLAVGYARGDLGQMLAQLYPQEKTI